jgi:hypothetical protein
MQDPRPEDHAWVLCWTSLKTNDTGVLPDVLAGYSSGSVVRDEILSLKKRRAESILMGVWLWGEAGVARCSMVFQEADERKAMAVSPFSGPPRKGLLAAGIVSARG